MRCTPGCSGTCTSAPRAWIGRSSSPMSTCCSSLPSGRVSTWVPPWLVRTDSVSVDTASRRLGVTCSCAWSMVTVCPLTDRGWSTASSSCSPGQGRYSGSQAPSAVWRSGASPSAAQAKTGLHDTDHTSVQGLPVGAVRVMVSLSSRVESQDTAVLSRSRLTSTSAPSTWKPSSVTASPGSRGTRMESG